MSPSAQIVGTRRRGLRRAGALCAFALACAPGPASTPPGQSSSGPGAPSSADLAVPPRQWAEAAVVTEEHLINYDGNAALRYRVRKIDAKGESVREVIESREGSVARLVAQYGQPLTAEANAAERVRLQDILDSPDAFLRHLRRDDGSKTYAIELLHSMPKAMLWTYVPGQPQLPGAGTPAVVLDFQPDPAFRAPSLITEGLTGIAGRLWVDVPSHYVTRIQGRILHPVDFGWGGVLARIKEGGSIELEQRKASDRRWIYSHFVEHIFIREVLVHTVEENTDTTAFDPHPLPAPVSFREAIQQLLALPVPTR